MMEVTTITKTQRSSGRTSNGPDLIRVMPNIADHNIANHISIQRSNTGVSTVCDHIVNAFIVI